MGTHETRRKAILLSEVETFFLPDRGEFFLGEQTVHRGTVNRLKKTPSTRRKKETNLKHATNLRIYHVTHPPENFG